jgi:hypothetical protein
MPSMRDTQTLTAVTGQAAGQRGTEAQLPEHVLCIRQVPVHPEGFEDPPRQCVEPGVHCSE